MRKTFKVGNLKYYDNTSALDYLSYLAKLLIYTLSTRSMKKNSEYNLPLSIAYFDYQKAFNSVETTAVITDLKELNLFRSIS